MEIFHTPLPFYETLIINPFLNPRILANHDKVEGLSSTHSMVKSLYKGDCFSIVKSLLLSNTIAIAILELFSIAPP